MNNINQLISACTTVISNVRKKPKPDVISASFMEINKKRTGIRIGTKRYWPVEKDQYICFHNLPDDGVVIRDVATAPKFKPNSSIK